MERQASASLDPMSHCPVMETAQPTIAGLRRKALILEQVAFPGTDPLTQLLSNSAVTAISQIVNPCSVCTGYQLS